MANARILVVEDENAVAGYLKLSLNNMGHAVVAVCGYGEEAVTQALLLRPDLVLMDINLCGRMSGVEAAGKIRESLDIPIVYLTACDDEETQQRAKLTEPFGYVLKPFKKKELQTTIEMTLYRHNKERELKERQSFIEAILSNIQSGIIVTDLDRRIVLINPYALNCIGGTGHPHPIGRRLEDVCPSFADALLKQGEAGEFICIGCAKEHGIGFRKFAMKCPDGKVISYIISFADLSEIAKVRKEMKMKERLAAIGEVVAIVAHEMRNPLFGITSVAQIFAMELTLAPEHEVLMKSLMNEARKLNTLIQDLLDSSKEITLRKKFIDLNHAIMESINVLEPMAYERKITIRTDMPEGTKFLIADPERIKQVLSNLLKNALDATPPDGSIFVTTEGDENSIAITIKDSGQGISERTIEKIFDIFYTSKKSGTGLGLFICNRIVSAHGGSLAAGNNPEGGAFFTVTLPRDDDAYPTC